MRKETRNLLDLSIKKRIHPNIETGFDVFFDRGYKGPPFYHTELREGDYGSVPANLWRGLIRILSVHSHPRGSQLTTNSSLNDLNIADTQEVQKVE